MKGNLMKKPREIFLRDCWKEMIYMKKMIGIILTILGMGIIILSLVVKVKGQMATAIIGGADGPTSIFLAGKVGNNFLAGVIVGVVLFAVGVFMIVRKK
jgi:oxaloacetate decarboxylase beta subunit